MKNFLLIFIVSLLVFTCSIGQANLSIDLNLSGGRKVSGYKKTRLSRSLKTVSGSFNVSLFIKKKDQLEVGVGIFNLFNDNSNEDALFLILPLTYRRYVGPFAKGVTIAGGFTLSKQLNPPAAFAGTNRSRPFAYSHIHLGKIFHLNKQRFILELEMRNTLGSLTPRSGTHAWLYGINIKYYISGGVYIDKRSKRRRRM